MCAGTREIQAIQVINANHHKSGFRAVIFDFDGTLSLLRRNWQDVMIPMMVSILRETPTPESESLLRDVVEEFVMRLNGRQTIYQMMQLAEEVARRGGQPLDPLAYKHQYHELLWATVSRRIEALRSGRRSAEEMAVPHAREFLDDLLEKGLTLYLASGTDLAYVRDELTLLGLADAFGDRVYGALDDYKRFSKAMIIEGIIRETGVRGSQIIGVGDGFVEIEEVKKVDGLAIGVASEETKRQGINAWKRERLIRAGADIIIGDYRCRQQLLELLSL